MANGERSGFEGVVEASYYIGTDFCPNKFVKLHRKTVSARGLNSFKALRHSSSETILSHDNFSSSFKEVTFSVSKNVSLGCVRVSDLCGL